MSKALQLDAMSRAEKLRALQAIWHDLGRNKSDITSPDWNEPVMQSRQARRRATEEWKVAQRRLRGKLT